MSGRQALLSLLRSDFCQSGSWKKAQGGSAATTTNSVNLFDGYTFWTGETTGATCSGSNKTIRLVFSSGQVNMSVRHPSGCGWSNVTLNLSNRYQYSGTLQTQQVSVKIFVDRISTSTYRDQGCNNFRYSSGHEVLVEQYPTPGVYSPPGSFSSIPNGSC